MTNDERLATNHQPPITNHQSKNVIIIGAGPAGLTAAWELARHGVPVTVLEKYHLVGGIARTEQYKGYYFDIGGHRFFTHVDVVNKLWNEWMGDELMLRPRTSRIYYDGKFFDYPLRAFNALFNMGLWRSSLIMLSYIRYKIFPYKEEDTFEQWVTNRFGKRLFEIFFKTYTEKVWGIPTSEIRAEWAAQRIKGLSLFSAVRNALFKPRGEQIKTLIEEFHYPERGPGMMWERVVELLAARGCKVIMNADAVAVTRDGDRVTGVQALVDGRPQFFPATDAISSAPLTELIAKIDPPVPPDIAASVKHLSYRDFITVVLILDKPNLFPDNWIYVHSPDVQVGRIQNFANWSPHMVPNPNTSSLGLEYFCSEGDALWQMPEAELLALGQRELEAIGLSYGARVLDGTVVRQLKAYPVYDAVYATHLAVVKQYLAGLGNLQTIGRNGLHKYNNQDHSMLTAIYAVENMLGLAQHDLWEVNTERSYHEEVRVNAKGKPPEEKPVDILEV
ncbi:MAG: NAD(P)/FAD-dependent oxidoreductase [Chloroflexi bacterium]|nr:NAD(P)/FAD-dependent oxidoreductase [Chloroflexota bacterium]